MQIVERLLRVTGSVGEWTNELGKREETPEVAVGVGARLRFDLRSPEGDPDTHILLPLAPENVESLAYYLALDSDYIQETSPRLLSTSNIQVVSDDEHTYLEADLPNTALPELLDALENQESVELTGELGGYSGGNDPTCADFVIQFKILIRNRIYLGTADDVPPEVEEDPRYLTAEQVKALIAEALRPPKGLSGRRRETKAIREPPRMRLLLRVDMRERKRSGSPASRASLGNPPTRSPSRGDTRERKRNGSQA